MTEKLLFTTEEAAELLNVSRTTVYAMVRRGVLGHIRGEGKGPTNIYIPKEELDKYIHSRMKYGHTVTLPPEQAAEAAENLEKARQARSKKSAAKKGDAPLEAIQGTIYAMGLKTRTFNLLHKAGYLTLAQVNLNDPEVARKLACLPRFGVSCWTDLEKALAREMMAKVGEA